MLKNLTVGLLLDFYAFILTDKQVKVLSMYYNDDMSLSEIANEMTITRQAALDFIKRGSNKLQKIEDELKLYKKFNVVTVALQDARDYCEQSDNKQLQLALDNALKVWEDA